MTFIAVVTSPRFVFSSCDLRVTSLRGNSILSQSDWAIKTTLLDSDELLGFTGFARIGGQLTDQWLASALAGVVPSARLEHLTKASTAEFNRLRLLEPHAFLGVGFHDLGKKRVPHAWVVTNAWDDYENRYDPRFLDSSFRLRQLELDGSRLSNLWTVGGEDENGETTHASVGEARDEIEQLVRRSTADPRPVMDRLARLNREMAGLGDHIGATAVVTSLPRRAKRDTGLVMWLEQPNLESFNRFPVSTNYVSDFRGTHPQHFRQPGIVSESGFSVLGAVSAMQAEEIGPDPHRGPSGLAFGPLTTRPRE